MKGLRFPIVLCLLFVILTGCNEPSKSGYLRSDFIRELCDSCILVQEDVTNIVKLEELEIEVPSYFDVDHLNTTRGLAGAVILKGNDTINKYHPPQIWLQKRQISTPFITNLKELYKFWAEKAELQVNVSVLDTGNVVMGKDSAFFILTSYKGAGYKLVSTNRGELPDPHPEREIFNLLIYLNTDKNQYRISITQVSDCSKKIMCDVLHLMDGKEWVK